MNINCSYPTAMYESILDNVHISGRKIVFAIYAQKYFWKIIERMKILLYIVDD